MTAKIDTSTGLYWNSHGAVACLRHAPGRNTDSWKWEKWTVIRPADLAALRRERGGECESCECQRAREAAVAMTDLDQKLLLDAERQAWPHDGTSAELRFREFYRLGYVEDGELTPLGERVCMMIRRIRGT